MGFLSQALNDITYNPELHMECVSRSEMLGVGVRSTEDVMLSMCPPPPTGGGGGTVRGHCSSLEHRRLSIYTYVHTSPVYLV